MLGEMQVIEHIERFSRHASLKSPRCCYCLLLLFAVNQCVVVFVAAAAAGYDAVEPEAVGEQTELSFRSTCQTALDACYQKFACNRALKPVLRHCSDFSRCSQPQCLEALQHFYRNIDVNNSIDIAFCQCK